MAFTYDTTTSRGKVRLLIGDTDTSTVANQIYTDAEIDAFLSMEKSVVRRAAASALESMAASQAMILKVLKVLDLETDGASLAKELRAQAAILREQAEVDDASSGWDYAEMVYDPFTRRERVWKENLRGNL